MLTAKQAEAVAQLIAREKQVPIEAVMGAAAFVGLSQCADVVRQVLDTAQVRAAIERMRPKRVELEPVIKKP